MPESLLHGASSRFDQLEIALGVKALHDDDGAAHLDGEIDRGLRRRVIERRGRQIDHAFAVLPDFYQEIEQRQFLGRRLLRQRPQNPFRTPGGARRIKHRSADIFVRDRGRRQSGGHGLKAYDTIALAFAVSDDTKFDLRAYLDRLARDVELCL